MMTLAAIIAQPQYVILILNHVRQRINLSHDDSSAFGTWAAGVAVFEAGLCDVSIIISSISIFLVYPL